MRFLRNKYLARVTCVTMCIITLQSTVLPAEVWALSNDPVQTEYGSYESPGATDMVNLLTGDFSYTMPVITVPGPEGGFDVPLFYHAGINPEDDASWVGLGWNMNVGSITRSISGYPDDAYDQTLSVNVNDPGGSGYVKNYVLYSHTYDSQTGHGGAISLLGLLGVSWDKGGLKTGTVLGVEFNKNGSLNDLAYDVL